MDYPGRGSPAILSARKNGRGPAISFLFPEVTNVSNCIWNETSASVLKTEQPTSEIHFQSNIASCVSRVKAVRQIRNDFVPSPKLEIYQFIF